MTQIAERRRVGLFHFGRLALGNRNKRNRSKPETFDFLGFTHYCSKSKMGGFRVKRKTSVKKFNAKLKIAVKWLYYNMHTELGELIKQLNVKLKGHFRYYGITDNISGINSFRYYVMRKLFKVLNCRSQRKSLTWDGFVKMQARFPLAKARIYVDIYG